MPRDSAPTVREADQAPPPDAKVKVTYRGGKKGKRGSKTVPVTSVPTSDDGATIELKAFRVPGKDQPVSIEGFAFVADGQDADGALALAALQDGVNAAFAHSTPSRFVTAAKNSTLGSADCGEALG